MTDVQQHISSKYQNNTENSVNIIVQRFYYKLLDSHESFDSHAMSEVQSAEMHSRMSKLKRSLSNINAHMYKAKGFIKCIDTEQAQELKKYKTAIRKAHNIIHDITSTYHNFLLSIENDVEVKNNISSDKRYCMRRLDQDLIILKNKLNASAETELKESSYENNPHSFYTVLDEHYQKKSTTKVFLIDLKQRWNVDKAEFDDILGMDTTKIFRENSKADSAVSRRVSQQQMGENNEKVIVTLSGDPSLGTNDEIIKNYKQKIKAEFEFEQKLVIAGEMLGKLYKRNDVVKRNEEDKNTSRVAEINDFIYRGVELSNKRISWAVSLVPFVSEEQRKELPSLLKGITEDVNTMISSGLYGRKQIFEILLKESKMGKLEYLEHLDVDFSVLDNILNDQPVKLLTAVKLSSKIGVNEYNSKTFLKMMTDHAKIPIAGLKEYYEKALADPTVGLKKIRTDIGLLRKDIAAALEVSGGLIERCEQSDTIPSNKMDKALAAYRVPQECQEKFIARFKREKKKLDILVTKKSEHAVVYLQ